MRLYFQKVPGPSPESTNTWEPKYVSLGGKFQIQSITVNILVLQHSHEEYVMETDSRVWTLIALHLRHYQLFGPRSYLT